MKFNLVSIVETLIGWDEGLISRDLIDLYSKTRYCSRTQPELPALQPWKFYQTITQKTICWVISEGNNDINRECQREERLDYDGIKQLLCSEFSTTFEKASSESL